MNTFKKFITEKIIIPVLPTLTNLLDNPIKYNVKFINIKNSLGGGYKEGVITINLYNVKTNEDLYTFLYHESIHKIQDEKSLVSIFKIIRNGRIKQKSTEDLFIYNVSNSFEIMAYASTMAIYLKLKLLPLKGFNKTFLDSKFKNVYSIIQKSKDYKKFKKYLYMYYKDIDIPDNIIKEEKMYSCNREKILDGFITLV